MWNPIADGQFNILRKSEVSLELIIYVVAPACAAVSLFSACYGIYLHRKEERRNKNLKIEESTKQKH